MNKKILFIIPNLSSGGVETSLINLISVLSDSFQIDLLIMGKNARFIERIPSGINLLPSTVKLQVLATPQNQTKQNFGWFWYFYRFFWASFAFLFSNRIPIWFFCHSFKTPGDYLASISWANNLSPRGLYAGANYLALHCCHAQVRLGWIHNDYVLGGIECRRNDRQYLRFDKAVCISEGLASTVCKFLPLEKVAVVHCLASTKTILELSKKKIIVFDQSVLNIVTVARIDSQKGILRALDCFSEIQKRGFSFHWHVIGEGAETAMAIKKAHELGLDSLVTFYGFQKNPYPYIAACDLFALFSFYEGAPISILEAKALGKRIFTTKFISWEEECSPSDIVVENSKAGIVDGLISFFSTPSLDNNGISEVKEWNERGLSEFLNLLDAGKALPSKRIKK